MRTQHAALLTIGAFLSVCEQALSQQQYPSQPLYNPPSANLPTFPGSALPATAQQQPYQQPGYQQPPQQFQQPGYQQPQPGYQQPQAPPQQVPQQQQQQAPWGGNPMPNSAGALPPQIGYATQPPETNWDKLEQDIEEELPETDSGIFGLFILLWVMICICGCVYNKNNGDRGMDIVPGAAFIYKIDDALFDGKVTGIHRYGDVTAVPIDIGKYVPAFSNVSSAEKNYTPINGGTVAHGPTKEITQDQYQNSMSDV